MEKELEVLEMTKAIKLLEKKLTKMSKVASSANSDSKLIKNLDKFRDSVEKLLNTCDEVIPSRCADEYF